MSAVTSSSRDPELDKYELLGEIGHGGMATVYKARDIRLDREVAVKIIHKHLRDNAEVRRRFISEAKAVAKLRHPGIVEVYDVSDDEDVERYLVVELIRGKTLRQLLTDHGQFPAEIAAIVVSILCDAVAHAHALSVIHRDIKPENVLVELPDTTTEATQSDPPRGHSDPPRGDSHPPRRRSEAPRGSHNSSESSRVIVKLTDFGIAKVLDAQGVTSTGQILGSPAHMAPEQIEGGAVGPHTDVFALGVLFYECMVGHLPFEGKNPAQVLRRVLEGDYEQADSERPQVGGRWARIASKALDIDVNVRVATAVEFGAMLNDELAELGIDDPRGELADYLSRPAEYVAELTNDLVPRLLERGEEARKRGLVHGAAADFNRALAFRPDDLTILKRVSTLGAERMWRQRLSRLGAIALGGVVLGGAAYGVTRLVRDDGVEGPARRFATNLPSAIIPEALPSVAPPLLPVRPPPPSPSASVSATPDTSNSVHQPPPTPAGDTRKVRFRVNPGGATFKLDGRKRDWTATVELPVGSDHSVTADPPESNPTCCMQGSNHFVVPAPPSDAPDTPYVVVVNVRYKAAGARLIGGPDGGVVSCSNGLQATKSSAGSRPITAVSTKVTCSFSPGGGSSSVTLRAGETVSIPWRP